MNLQGQRSYRFLIVLVILFFLNPSVPSAERSTIPQAIGDIYVQDFANVLTDSQENELLSIGRSVENKTTAQIAVLTIDTIGNSTIEEFANEAFRTYQIGTKEENNGVLLVLSMKERKIRIEVGYGLEGVIPDGKAGRILDQYAIPSLQNGKPDIAIMNTFKVLAREVSGDGNFADTPSSQTAEYPIPTWLIIILVISAVFLDMKFFGGTLTYALLSMLSRGGGRGGGGPRGGGGGSSGGGGASRGW